jgi:hypothetical protein
MESVLFNEISTLIECAKLRSAKRSSLSLDLIFLVIFSSSGHEWFAACSEIAASSLHGLEA